MNHLSADISNTLEERVQRIAEEVIRDPALFLVEVNIRGVKGSRVIEIFVDSDRNIDIDTLASLNREIGFLLEAGDVIEGRYNLNVSSPGLDRPLTMPGQYRKNTGRPLRIKMRHPEGTKTIKGTLTKVSDDAIELKLANGEEYRIPFDAIEESKVVLPW
jgi:ribosome maturation factor RimP